MEVSHAMPLPTNPCPHELRPGTTVCLHCRWEARSATKRRRRRLFMKGSSGLALLSTLAVMGLVGRVAFEKRLSSPRLRVATATVMSDAEGDAAKAIAAAPSTAQQGATMSAAPAPVSATPATPSPVSPVVPQGQSTLPDS